MSVLDWLTRRQAAAPMAGTPVRASDDAAEVLRYPPFLRGLPVTPPEQLLTTQSTLIGQLQDALAFTDARFATLVQPVVSRYAAFVHLLPASEAHHHRGAGGLLRHGLEVACRAAQASQGRVFALDRPPSERRALEPRWHLAAGLAGLCHDLGKPVSDVAVTDREGSHTWQPFLAPLTDWAASHAITRYHLRWRPERHQQHALLGPLVLERVLTAEVMAWLGEADPAILHALVAAVAGLDPEAVLTGLVRRADQASVEEDLRANHLDPAALSLGVPVERYLLDAMRRLVRAGRWTCNVPGARLWRFAEGLHVVWPAGAEDILALLAEDRVPGIPRDSDTLADILLERALAVPCADADGAMQRYWRLAPEPLARAGQVVTLSMLRLASPDLVLEGAPAAVVALARDDERAGVEADCSTAAPVSGGPPGPAAAASVAASAHASQPTGKAHARAQADAPDDSAVVAVLAGAASPTNQAAVPQSAGFTSAVPEASPVNKPPAGPGSTPIAVQGQAEQSAAASLGARGAGGAVLLTLAEAIRSTPGAHAARLRGHNGQLVILFPDGLADLGAPPQAQLDALAADGLLDSDPLAPLRRVTAIDGRHGARLTPEASRALQTLIGDIGPVQEALGPARAADTDTQRQQEPGNGNAQAERATSAERPRRASPALTEAARALVARVRAGDPALPGGVVEADGWRTVSRQAIDHWAQAHGLRAYALIRTLGSLAGCRITPAGGLTVRPEP
jgi:conjugal transfer pilus assembly protein TraI